MHSLCGFDKNLELRSYDQTAVCDPFNRPCCEARKNFLEQKCRVSAQPKVHDVSAPANRLDGGVRVAW